MPATEFIQEAVERVLVLEVGTANFQPARFADIGDDTQAGTPVLVIRTDQRIDRILIAFTPEASGRQSSDVAETEASTSADEPIVVSLIASNTNSVYESGTKGDQRR